MKESLTKCEIRKMEYKVLESVSEFGTVRIVVQHLDESGAKVCLTRFSGEKTFSLTRFAKGQVTGEVLYKNLKTKKGAIKEATWNL